MTVTLAGSIGLVLGFFLAAALLSGRQGPAAPITSASSFCEAYMSFANLDRRLQVFDNGETYPESNMDEAEWQFRLYQVANHAREGHADAPVDVSPFAVAAYRLSQWHFDWSREASQDAALLVAGTGLRTCGAGAELSGSGFLALHFVQSVDAASYDGFD